MGRPDAKVEVRALHVQHEHRDLPISQSPSDDRQFVLLDVFGRE